MQLILTRDLLQDCGACNIGPEFINKFNFWGVTEEEILSLLTGASLIKEAAWWTDLKKSARGMLIINKHHPGFCTWGPYKTLDSSISANSLIAINTLIDEYKANYTTKNEHVVVTHAKQNNDSSSTEQIVPDYTTSTEETGFQVVNYIDNTTIPNLSKLDVPVYYTMESEKALEHTKGSLQIQRLLTSKHGDTIWVSIDDPMCPDSLNYEPNQAFDHSVCASWIDSHPLV